jgi:hypothetical protein
VAAVNHPEFDPFRLMLAQGLVENRRVIRNVEYVMVAGADVQRHDQILRLARLDMPGAPIRVDESRVCVG